MEDTRKIFLIDVGLAAARRYGELIITSFVLSVIATLLNISQAVSLKPYVLLMLVIGTVIFLVINIVQMRDCYFELGNAPQYYLANLFAYGLFSVTTVVVYKVSNFIFTWIFGITKFMRYLPIDVPAKYSLLLFLAILGIAVLLAPIGMQKIVEEDEAAMLEEMESMEIFEEGLAQTQGEEE